MLRSEVPKDVKKKMVILARPALSRYGYASRFLLQSHSFPCGSLKVTLDSPTLVAPADDEPHEACCQQRERSRFRD
jgi:hypothetical protein